MRLLMLVLAGVAGAGAISWGYWNFKVKPRIEAIEGRGPVVKTGRFRSLKNASTSAEFDRAFTLPGSPLAMAWDGKQFIVGDRKGGVIRIKPDGDDMDAQSAPIIEPVYRQNIGVWALAWNGTNFVGYVQASWFQQGDGYVFTIHDRTSLNVLEHKPAPNHLGCLAFDGTSYWAATRRNTADSPEPALLYKFDRNLAVVSTVPAPGVGCQGMTWDGRYLWLADVFSDSISILDPATHPPRLVKSHATSVGYLSGIAAADGEIWVTDYGDNRLQRLKPATRVAWAGGASPAPTLAGMIAPPPITDGDLQELRRKLRSDQWSERLSANMELSRRNEPIDFARDEERSPDRPDENSEVLDWQIELRGGAIYASWRIWFGHKLFSEVEQEPGFVTVPKLARYTFTIRDPSGAEAKKEFDASPGENIMRDVHLADASLPGEYRVDLFIHVQYVTPERQARILNNSEMGLELRK
jgi:hypothetical protein